MLGTRHQTLPRARRLGPLSVSALLAFALFPALAVAEDSSGIQYSDAPPTVTGKTSQQDSANSSGADGGKGGSGQSSMRSGSTDGKSDDRSKTDDGGAAGGQGGGDGEDDAGAGQGESGDERGQAPSPIDAASTSADAGGSPLVPILIALAVLAAISIGVVAMRRKRSDADPGAPVSPEAS